MLPADWMLYLRYLLQTRPSARSDDRSWPTAASASVRYSAPGIVRRPSGWANRRVHGTCRPLPDL